jgi:leucyl/phenylalanyl-tRNA--protein transferase
MFCGESMFSAQSGASSIALAALARRLHAWGWPLIDAQVASDHLYTLGGFELPRDRFAARVSQLAALPGRPGPCTDALDGLVPDDL